MKNIFYAALIITTVLLLAPMAALTAQKSDIEKGKAVAVFSEQKTETEDRFRVLSKDGKSVENMSSEDYICGVVAAEMPALYETEALKAQAVAAYTFACRRREQNKSKDYDISVNSAVDQAFISLDDAIVKWGENGQQYAEKIRKAVKSVLGKKVYYKGEPALTVYHAVSSGKTENVSALWGNELPYLTSVDSVWDKLSPNYMSNASFTCEELSDKLGEGVSLNGNGKDIVITEKTEAGTVKSVTVGGKKFTGDKLRQELSLKSLCFGVSFKNGCYDFECFGYGHGVGMSQYGADYMAKQGRSYKEILKHYYKGTTVK